MANYEETMLYSIQQTYTIKPVSKLEKRILTCEQRIDIPTIEPLTNMKAVVYSDKFSKIIPCIELAGNFLGEFKLTFETNEGVTVLPVQIYPGTSNPLDNPYMPLRYVLVLPRGATGVKSCKIIHNATGKEVQHNFTFGIMPPPYNYDNALFGYLSYKTKVNYDNIINLESKVNKLKLKTKPTINAPIELPKNAGKQTIDIEDWELFFDTTFSYTSSPDPTIHNPKITLHGSGVDLVYTLSLSRATNTVSIDLFTYMLTVYDKATGEIMEQFKIDRLYDGFKTLSFENFDDIEYDSLYINARGAVVNE